MLLCYFIFYTLYYGAHMFTTVYSNPPSIPPTATHWWEAVMT